MAAKQAAGATQAKASNLETSSEPRATESTAEAGVFTQGHASMGGGLASHALSYGRLTPDRYQAAVKAVGGGIRRHAALVLAGVPSRTADHWLAILAGRATHWPDGSAVSQEFTTFLARLAEDFARAEAERERQVVQNIVRAAEAVNEKTGIPEWRAGAWLMEHAPAYKRDYAEYREQRIEHAGSVDHTLRTVQALPDQALIDLLPDDWKELVDDAPVTALLPESG